MMLDVFIVYIILYSFYYSRFVKCYYMILELNRVKVLVHNNEIRRESKNKNEN